MPNYTHTENRMSNDGGFTLLEVLFAMAIATFGFLCLALMQGVSTKGNVVGNRVTQATFLAQQGIEQAKNASYDLVDMGTFPKGTALSGTFTDSNIDITGAGGGIFTRTTTFSSYSAASRTVQVAVSWNAPGWDSQPKTHTITLTTTTRGDGN